MAIEVKQKKLTNFKVIERQDTKGQKYFIIFDEDNHDGKNAYFCWPQSLGSANAWTDLVENYNQWREIEIEWEEREKGNKVINIWSDTNKNDFLI